MKQPFEQLYDYGFYFIPTLNKVPAIIDGKMMGATSGTRDKETIEFWLNKLDMSLSVVGGKTAGGDFLVMLDIDTKKENGEHTLALLENEYGKLPVTLEVMTPSVGRHLYFLTDEEIGSSVDAFGKKFEKPSGIDIKGKNGYCQCPPTRGYTFIWDMAPARLPADWKVLLKSLIAMHHRGKATFSNPPDANVIKDYNEKNDIRDVLSKHGYQHEGGMYFTHPHGATTRRNVNLVPNDSFTPHGAKYVSFHWGAHDLVRSGPHDAFDIEKIISYGGSHQAMVNAYKSPEVGCSWFEMLRPVNEIRSEPGLEMIEYHWEQGDLLTLTGDSESYKTFFILDAAFSLATGLPFLNHFPVRTPAIQSAMFLTESSRDFSDRRNAWIKSRAAIHDIDEAELLDIVGKNVFGTFSHMPVCPHKDGPTADELYRKMIPTNMKCEPRILFLDHFNNNFTANGFANENDNGEVGKFINLLKRRSEKDNVSIVMIHHPPKPGSNGSKYRGASVFHNNISVSYNFVRKKDSNLVNVQQAKCSYYNGYKPYAMKPEIMDLYMNHNTIRPRMRTGLALSWDRERTQHDVSKLGRPNLVDVGELCRKIGEGKTVSIKDVQKLYPDIKEATLRCTLSKGCVDGVMACDNTKKLHTWIVLCEPPDLDN